MKRCRNCGITKDDAEFYRARENGLRSECKVCGKLSAVEWQKRKVKTSADVEKKRMQDREYRQRNIERWNEYDRRRYADGVLRSLWGPAKKRAARDEVPFDIAPADIVIPEFCPVLGIRLERGVGHVVDSSPTIDRIIAERGYVKGNIQVISHKANTMKSSATPEELLRFAEWVLGYFPARKEMG